MEVCELRRVPVIGVRCGKPEHNDGYDDSAEIPAFLLGKHTYILRAEDKSMYKLFYDFKAVGLFLEIPLASLANYKAL